MKIGFVAGAFDLLHAGHIDMLRQAKIVCDFLKVGLQLNPQFNRPEKNKPVQSIVERQIQLLGCKYVDNIIIYETERDLLDILSIEPIDIRIVGEDWKEKEITGQQLCKERGIEIYYNKRSHLFSTSELIERIKKS